MTFNKMGVAPSRTKLLELLGHKRKDTAVPFDLRDYYETDDWLEEPDWDAVDRWLTEHPREARLAMLVDVTDPPESEDEDQQSGMRTPAFGEEYILRHDRDNTLSPLSIALWHRRRPAPPRVVAALVKHCPEALLYDRDDEHDCYQSISGDRHNKHEWLMRLHPIVNAARNSALSREVFGILLEGMRCCREEALVDMHILNRVLLDEHWRCDVELIKDITDSSSDAIASGIIHDGCIQYPMQIALNCVAPVEVIRLLLTKLKTYPKVYAMNQNYGLQCKVRYHYEDGKILETEKDVLETAVDAWANQISNSSDDNSSQGSEVDLKERILRNVLECFRFVGAQRANLDEFEDFPPILGAVVYASLSSKHPRRSLAVVKRLIERDRTRCYEAQDSLGRTALHVAVDEIAELCKHFDRARLDPMFIAMVNEGYSSFPLEEWQNFLREYLIEGDDGAAARVVDNEGNLPLHLAAGVTNGEGYCLTIEGGLGVLLEAFPGAAEIQNHAGEFPLERAIKSGLGRDEGLELLTRASTKALHSQDRKRGVSVFMIAASDDFLAEKTHPDVDTIYMLLRENPNAVARGFSPSSYELYLENKLLQSRKENAKIVADFEKRQVELTRQISELKKENSELKEQSQYKRRKC